jgi:hypothetical protein
MSVPDLVRPPDPAAPAAGDPGATGLRVPNPRRVAAGRRNRQLRRGLTDTGRQRLREAAAHHQPWQHATGPRTHTGKARAAANGRGRQQEAVSRRELQRVLTDLLAGIGE